MHISKISKTKYQIGFTSIQVFNNRQYAIINNSIKLPINVGNTYPYIIKVLYSWIKYKNPNLSHFQIEKMTCKLFDKNSKFLQFLCFNHGILSCK